MSLESFMIRHITYPLYVLYKGKDNRGEFFNIDYFKYIKKHEFFSKEMIEEIQKKKLYDLVDYTVKNIPFYIDYKKENDFEYRQETILSDIKKLPLLSKDIIRHNFKKLHKLRGIDYIYNTSGGSTGEPIKLIQDMEYLQKKITLYTNNLAGLNIGDRVLKLWGSDRDMNGLNRGLKNKIINNVITRVKSLNTFKMSKKDMMDYTDAINQYKPKVIISYVQSAYEMAKFIEKNRLTVYKPESIITSAGTLHNEQRKKIEKIFDCNVYNRYGSREVGIVAMECQRHEGLHISSFNHYVEILKEDGTEAKEGEIGEVIITLLTNYTMPLIRYRIGDMAIKTNLQCSCGRGFPLIKSVVGRTVNVFKNKKGELIDGEYFTHLFYFMEFIEKFQVIQVSYNEILIKLVLVNRRDFEIFKIRFSQIEGKIKEVMGSDCKVYYQVCNDIPPTASGKYIYTISNVG